MPGAGTLGVTPQVSKWFVRHNDFDERKKIKNYNNQTQTAKQKHGEMTTLIRKKKGARKPR